ncbi:MAG: hypothetical protein ABI425_00275 [Patescibacteria group bacterium]
MPIERPPLKVISATELVEKFQMIQDFYKNLREGDTVIYSVPAPLPNPEFTREELVQYVRGLSDGSIPISADIEVDITLVNRSEDGEPVSFDLVDRNWQTYSLSISDINRLRRLT